MDIILTTNFDPLITRSLAHFNLRPNVYDVPNTKNFRHTELITPAVVYLHGQLKSFITVHTIEEDEDIREDVRHALREAVCGRSLIVSGYSGENDPIFADLCDPVQFKHGLFWIHHTEGDPRRNVLNGLFARSSKHAYYIENEPADMFFPHLAQVLGAQSTSIAFKPFSYLAEVLDELAPVETDHGPEELAAEVKSQVRMARKCFEERAECPRASRQFKNWKGGYIVTQARAALLEGRYGELDPIEAEARDVKNLEALTLVARARFDQAKRLSGDDAVGKYAELAARFGTDKAPAIREQVARALFNKGVALRRLGRPRDAIRTCDEVVTRFGGDKAPVSREAVARALLDKGTALYRLGRTKGGIKAFGEAVARCGEDKEPAIRERVAKALFGKGVAFTRLGRAKDGIKAYDEVVARFGEDREPAIQGEVAKALFNKGIVLNQLGRAEDGIKAYDEVVTRFAGDKESAIRMMVARALCSRGVALDRLGRAKDELKVYDEVVAGFGEDKEPAVREQVAKALVNKGIVLSRLGRAKGGIKACDEVLSRFGEDKSPAIREQVAGAVCNKGIALRLLGPLGMQSGPTTKSCPSSMWTRSRRFVQRSQGRYATRASRSDDWVALTPESRLSAKSWSGSAGIRS